MNRQMHIFLCYLSLIAVATIEVLMKLPFWIKQGCPLLLAFWTFKMPFLVIYIVWIIQSSASRTIKVKCDE